MEMSEVPELKIPAAGGGVEPAEPPAAFSERFLAYVIDALPFLAATYITLYFMVSRLGYSFTPRLELQWKLVWILVYIIYETVLSAGGRATLGKWALGIRVRSADGGPLALWRSFVRALGYFVSASLLNLGFALAYFTPGKRALHDYFASSKVVRVRPQSEFAAGLIFALAWGVFGLLAAASYYDYFLKPSPRDVKKISAVRAEFDRLSYLEELHKRQYGYYTDDINRLALISADAQRFRKELLSSVEPEGFEIGSSKDSYFFTARAKDRRKTRITQTGP